MIYKPGTMVLRRNGFVYRKVEGRGLIPAHRLIVEEKLKRTLEPNERVYHIDGDRYNNSKENLVPIRFNDKPFELLPTSRVITPHEFYRLGR